MPQIDGLQEQQEALARITKNLKKVADVNEFLKGVWEMSQDKNLEISQNILISFSNGEDMKKFKCPLLLPDMQPIYAGAQRYKEAFVSEIKKDAAEYRISLSQKEIEALDWKLEF